MPKTFPTSDPAHDRDRAQGGLLAILFVVAIVLLALAANALVALSASASERVVVKGADVAVFDVAGTVSVVGGSGPDVVVEVTRGGRDANRLRLETGPIGGRATLRVISPSDRVVYPGSRMGWGSRTQMRVREDGTWGGKSHGLFDPRTVTITGRGSGLEAWADLRIEVPKGQKAAIYLGVGTITAENVEGDVRLDGASASVKVDGARGNLLVDTGSGEVAVDGMRGDLNVDTGSGEVRLADVRGKNLLVDTGSGEVSGRGVSAASLHVDTGSGGIELSAVDAVDILLDTGSGSVELELVADADQVKIDTGSGSVTFRVPDGFGAMLNLSTGSGGIDSDLPLSEVRRQHDWLRGRVGDGRGLVVVDTGSGSIRLASR